MADLFPAPIEIDHLRLERLAPDAVDVHALYRSFWRPSTPRPSSSTSPRRPTSTRREPRTPSGGPPSTGRTARSPSGSSDRRRARRSPGAASPTTQARSPASPRCAPTGTAGGRAWGCCSTSRNWGRGYSGERAAALLAAAFDHLDLELVAVAHEAGNDNSRWAIRKYVEYFDGREDASMRNGAVTGGEPADQRRYSISRAEYRDAVGAE